MAVGPEYAQRRNRAIAGAHDCGAGGLLVTDPTNVRYLTGFTGSNGCLVLGSDTAVLVTDSRYQEQAAAQCPELEVQIARDSAAGAVRLGMARNISPLAVEANHLTLDRHRGLVEIAGQELLLETTGVVAELRRVKDAYEIAQLERAAEIITLALDDVLHYIAPGVTEQEIATRLERLVVDHGAEAPAFSTIVATGPNSAIPHHEPTDIRIRSGDLLKIDAGARINGYHSDMTRMFVVGDEPNPHQQELHDEVLVAADGAATELAVGVSAQVPDAVARERLNGLARFFSHGLGHGVGLQIHEAPMLSSSSADTIGPGDVLTIEPGVYLPGYGGVRIEDTWLVTAAGSRRLTMAPRELVRLG
ncbi:MAG: Xaa-Pro peptidase family protein [Actinomycetia bacterium]|nr:Xaa-Pro peptidase family protein [Actinomycetes bacterium]